MAKGKKLKRYSKKKFNYVASKYSKDKFDVTCRITIEANGVIKFQEHGSPYYTIEQILQDSTLYSTTSVNYQSMKVTGLAIECVPGFNPGEVNIRSNGIYILSYYSSEGNLSFSNVQESDKLMILNGEQRIRKYWKFGDGLTGWVDSSSVGDMPGRLVVLQSDAPLQGGAYWICRISVYVLFKNKVR